MNNIIKQNYKDHPDIKNLDEYHKIYERSISENDEFWSEKAERITWYKKWEKISDVNYDNAKIKWYQGGLLNACYNCLDRHVEKGNGN